EIQQNEKHIKKWTQYRDRHKQIIEGLKMLSLELSMNCIVPIGKRALMKGKLKHTSEILTCIGDGYFIKYTTQQAIALCNRRIKHSEEILKDFEQERNLLETRQMLPLVFDAFEFNNCENVVEHWDEKRLEDWKVLHKKKEKEYRQKLMKLKCQKKQKIETEDDLFKRLDQLELEEELADEFNRLDEEHQQFYGEHLQDNKIQPELQEDMDEDSSEESNKEEREHENKIYLKYMQENKVDKIETAIENTERTPDKDNKINGKFEVSIIKEDKANKLLDKLNLCIDSVSSHYQSGEIERQKLNNQSTATQNLSNDVPCLENDVDIEKSKGFVKRVSFAEPHFVEVASFSHEINENNKEEQLVNESDIDNDTIKINFTPSEIEPSICKNNTETKIMNPDDIYRIFCKPKSILKKSPDNEDFNKNTRLIDESIKEQITKDIETDQIAKSTYNLVVQDVQNRKIEETVTEYKESNNQNRPISRFKLERANLKKAFK
ncbi:PREDICTED: RNA polymerase II subunit 5-mediating protein homolog, partial [Ceratosolen solmsi marchali]|uniref:RNA polymerase II subunit 5-mediating protein homolog n=1 Tax=Ceratosolen solmsi marchali TaxID=326594 RepID=A0AAJ6YS33_9HYME